MIDAQLFLVTQERDLSWLNCCLRSVQKFWHSLYPPMIVATPQCKDALPKVVSELKTYVSFEPKWKDWGQGGSYLRMMADCYVTANWILYLDVDCLFTRDCTALDFSEDDRPIVVTESCSDLIRRLLPDAQNSLHNCIALVDEHLGVTMTNDYMRRAPYLFHRSSVRRTRKLIESTTKRPLADTVSQCYQPYWQELNFIGSYCEAFENSDYIWKDLSSARAPLIRRFSSAVQDPTKGRDFDLIREILFSESSSVAA